MAVYGSTLMGGSAELQKCLKSLEVTVMSWDRSNIKGQGELRSLLCLFLLPKYRDIFSITDVSEGKSQGRKEGERGK